MRTSALRWTILCLWHSARRRACDVLRQRFVAAAGGVGGAIALQRPPQGRTVVAPRDDCAAAWTRMVQSGHSLSFRRRQRGIAGRLLRPKRNSWSHLNWRCGDARLDDRSYRRLRRRFDRRRPRRRRLRGRGWRHLLERGRRRSRC